MRGLVMSFDPKFDYCLQQELRERNLPDKSLVELWPGVSFLPATGSETQKAILADPPVFLRHMFPVSELLQDVADYAQAAANFAEVQLKAGSRPRKISVQCRIMSGMAPESRDIKAACDAVIVARGHLPTVKNPEQILSYVCVPDALYAGFSSPRDNLTDWSGGAVHYRQSGDLLSRAGHKLEEAIEVFGIDLGGMRLALDLGAAPGGFTKFLLSRDMQVTAVDTAEMDSSLQGNPNLVVYRDNAFLLQFKPNAFDLVTCDMSWDSLRTARLLARLAVAIVPGGTLIMTVKFMGASPLKAIRTVLSVLSVDYNLISARQLWHNREEATLYLRRKGE